MGKITFTDAALREAAAAVRRSMLDSIPAGEDCPHAFPPEFGQTIRRLYEQTRAERKRTGHPALRRAAAVFLATLIALGTWLAVDDNARAAVLRWFREVYENSIVYRFTGQEEAKVLPEFELTWIPEGYEQTYLHHSEISCDAIYGLPGSKTDVFVLSYCLMSESTNMTIGNVDEPGISVEVNGVVGYFYPGTEASPASTLAWVREDLGVLIYINSRLDEADVLHIASELKLFISPK